MDILWGSKGVKYWRRSSSQGHGLILVIGWLLSLKGSLKSLILLLKQYLIKLFFEFAGIAGFQSDRIDVKRGIDVLAARVDVTSVVVGTFAFAGFLGGLVDHNGRSGDLVAANRSIYIRRLPQTRVASVRQRIVDGYLLIRVNFLLAPVFLLNSITLVLLLQLLVERVVECHLAILVS